MRPDVIWYDFFFCLISDLYQYRIEFAGIKSEMEAMRYLKCVLPAINSRQPVPVKSLHCSSWIVTSLTWTDLEEQQDGSCHSGTRGVLTGGRSRERTHEITNCSCVFLCAPVSQLASRDFATLWSGPVVSQVPGFTSLIRCLNLFGLMQPD